MGRHTYFGQLAAHDVMNGIDHANIDPELTVENWESKAIVRDGNYVWVRKGTYKDEQGKEITGYYVRVYASTPTLHLEKDFPEIETALAYGNALSEDEGEYPEEWGSPSFITMYPGLGTGPLTIEIPNKKGE